MQKAWPFIRRTDMTVFHFDETWLDSPHRLERTPFKVQQILSVSGCAFSEDAYWVKSATAIFNLNLTSHDRLNDLVVFFFCAASVNKDALEAFAQLAKDWHFEQLYFRSEAWMQGAQNKVKDLLKSDVVADYG